MIILLNGVSSSGKTSIAEELLRILDRPFFHIGVDAIGAMRSVPATAALSPDELAAVLRRTRAGFHRVIAGMAAAGNDVVADHVLSEPWRLPDCLAVLAGFDVVFVGVHCPPAELARRELARGDRTPGQAAAQLATVHQHGDYDLECDTGRSTPTECAHQIRDYLTGRDPAAPGAFARLRSACQNIV
ncbi:chloramphenicol 3-O phosphotransferase [Allocatelliglobosispora scoriae]|uniref:Chloramphenicol 3-O phosphotransferase n=1 Tax=Allocatelliglobosispora scoriae TaxID=643052 RepID=A0A841C038_9ACTN|nr:AAA family ATPase [Allocatelliglobosispora scoriae]MBB5872709.1 chloramphenicol 3-O phosphotransferase [Allocatelliglobosispora scoriae]